MPALNAKLLITRSPDFGSPLQQNCQIIGVPADPQLQDPSNYINFPYIIGTPADHPNGIFATIADAQADFLANILPNLIPVVNANYPLLIPFTTIGTISFFDQTLQDAFAAIPVAPKVYNGTTLRTNPVEYTNSGVVSSGSVVFQVTDNGLSTGNALFPNNRDFATASVSSTAAQYGFSFTWSNSNKTLTVGVAAITPVLGILGIATAANGVSVGIHVKGN